MILIYQNDMIQIVVWQVFIYQYSFVSFNAISQELHKILILEQLKGVSLIGTITSYAFQAILIEEFNEEFNPTPVGQLQNYSEIQPTFACCDVDSILHIRRQLLYTQCTREGRKEYEIGLFRIKSAITNLFGQAMGVKSSGWRIHWNDGRLRLLKLEK